MPIPTELVGSLPRPEKLQNAYEDLDQGKITFEDLQKLQDEAAKDSIERLEQTGETYVTDGEQRESSFATYPITDTLAGTGLADNLAGDGQFFAIFDDGHHRQLPRLTGGPFKYKTFASEFVEKNKELASKPVKQAVISPSMMMLLYPLEDVPRPIRLSTAETVEVAISSSSAISGPVNCTRRNAAIAWTRSSGVAFGISRGAELRSSRPASPSAR